MARVTRIVASTEAPGLEAPVAQVFARAPYFVVVDLEDGQVKGVWSYPNTLAGMGGGAGSMAAQWVASIGARIVVAPHVGINASQILAAAGIRVLQVLPGTRLRDALIQHGLLTAP